MNKFLTIQTLAAHSLKFRGKLERFLLILNPSLHPGSRHIWILKHTCPWNSILKIVIKILATVSASQTKLDLHSLAQEASPGQAHHLLQLHPLLLDTSMSLWLVPSLLFFLLLWVNSFWCLLQFSPRKHLSDCSLGPTHNRYWPLTTLAFGGHLKETIAIWSCYKPRAAQHFFSGLKHSWGNMLSNGYILFLNCCPCPSPLQPRVSSVSGALWTLENILQTEAGMERALGSFLILVARFRQVSFASGLWFAPLAKEGEKSSK